MGMSGCDQLKKNFQAPFRRERAVILPIRLFGLGKGVKYADYLFHASSISRCVRDARSFCGVESHVDTGESYFNGQPPWRSMAASISVMRRMVWERATTILW